MPTTSDGEFVYAEPERAEVYTQTAADQFSLSTSGDPSEWRIFVEERQTEAKARIDEYCGRDFENHPGDTVVLDVGSAPQRFIDLPTPVQSVSEVRVDGVAIPASDYRVGDEGFLIRISDELTTEQQLLEDALPSRPVWPAGYGNIEVDLDWGFTTVPNDIAEAEKKLVAHTVTGLTQMREGMIVQQDDIDVHVQLPEAMTPEIKQMLGAHRSGGRTMEVI